MDIPEIPDTVSTFIFDLDGTLVNTEPLHARALSSLLERIGLKSDPEELQERFIGIPDSAVYYEIFNQNSQISMTQFIREKTNQLLRIMDQISTHDLKQMLTPGAQEALGYLSQEGYQLAVGSASEAEIVLATIQKLGLRHYFPIVRASNSSFNSKPNPGVYFSIMRDYGVSSEQTLIFEDSCAGMQAASLTGSHIIRIGDPDKEYEEENDDFSDFDEIAVVDNFLWLAPESDPPPCQEDEAEEN